MISSIAINEEGIVGVIIQVFDLYYQDKKYSFYYGKNIYENKNWYSRNPIIIGKVSNLESFLKDNGYESSKSSKV
jgi:hypothetical protein